MSGFTIQQQPETDDLYAHEDKPEQELYYEDQEGEAKTYIESLSMHPRPSNLSCLCSSKGTAADHHDSHPFHKPLSHTEWCSADDLAKIGPGIKRRLPFTVSATEVANASTAVPLRQPGELKTRKQLPLEQEDLDVTLRGFTKITLPTTFSGNRFSDSAPGSSSHIPSSLSERMMPVSTNPTTPSPVKGSPLPAQQHGTVMPRPPLPPLRRTASDPIPASVYNVEESHNSQVFLIPCESPLLLGFVACKCFSHIFCPRIFKKAKLSCFRRNIVEDEKNINCYNSSQLQETRTDIESLSWKLIEELEDEFNEVKKDNQQKK